MGYASKSRRSVQFSTVSLATIYKTLVLLKDEGEVLEIDLRSDSRYDGNKPYPHPHLVCTRCGQIMDAEQVLPLSSIDQQIAEKYGFQVVRQHLLFYGICSECQASARNARA